MLSQALVVRGRVLAGREAGGNNAQGVGWSEDMGRQRLAEVVARMQGLRSDQEREALEALLLPTSSAASS